MLAVSQDVFAASEVKPLKKTEHTAVPSHVFRQLGVYRRQFAQVLARMLSYQLVVKVSMVSLLEKIVDFDKINRLSTKSTDGFSLKHAAE